MGDSWSGSSERVRQSSSLSSLYAKLTWQLPLLSVAVMPTWRGTVYLKLPADRPINDKLGMCAELQARLDKAKENLLSQKPEASLEDAEDGPLPNGMYPDGPGEGWLKLGEGGEGPALSYV